jgi:hypothetical protein
MQIVIESPFSRAFPSARTIGSKAAVLLARGIRDYAYVGVGDKADRRLTAGQTAEKLA